MSRRVGLTGLAVLALLTGCASEGAPGAGGTDVLPLIPGEPIVVLLGEPETYELSANRSFDLMDAPVEATHVRVSVQCTAPGTTTFGTDAGGNNPSSQCSEEDVATPADTGWMDFLLSADDALYVSVSEGAASRVTLQYATHTPTEWGVNAQGETFGGLATRPDAEPDLVAVVGRAADGSEVQGYVRSVELTSFGPGWPGQPSSPEEALAWQEERDLLYPDGWDLPVYESDGRTVIETFRVGN